MSAYMQFIELPLFTEAVVEAQAEESLRKLQLELCENPGKGDLIQGTAGFRKVRMRLTGRGKSGSLRAIYIHFAREQKIYFAMLYKKSDRDTLSHKQKEALKQISQQLRSVQ
jgi:hypothetical protein